MNLDATALVSLRRTEKRNLDEEEPFHASHEPTRYSRRGCGRYD